MSQLVHEIGSFAKAGSALAGAKNDTQELFGWIGIAANIVSIVLVIFAFGSLGGI